MDDLAWKRDEYLEAERKLCNHFPDFQYILENIGVDAAREYIDNLPPNSRFRNICEKLIC